MPQPLLALICQPSLGSRAAIEVKIRTDMPLPTPRSVISSPSHMTTPVPAVIVITRMVRVSHRDAGAVSGMIGNWSHALLEQLAGAGQRHERRGLQDAEAQGQVPGVLGDLRLAGLALLAELLQPRDDDGQQLQDDAAR